MTSDPICYAFNGHKGSATVTSTGSYNADADPARPLLPPKLANRLA